MEPKEVLMIEAVRIFNELTDYFNSSRAALHYLSTHGRVIDSALQETLLELVREEDANYKAMMYHYRKED